ncbi:hypothetical protein K3G63_06600 [Hymenobacter sp. HSC-4F20]|uniref:glycosyl hydrolase 108 family protein n=1 Tax=Hymenobacter sp. HSC-4F20 TaxID=2864135 RepID=UPI001C739D3F|nr:glycosyl hydrolase 108 family protein [Hymenobacter sp. HSC-4F20]MBX0290100.1 hypothetical protein [Hymenobacter sp. HSC-4F20]
MASFIDFYPILAANEGGYQADPNDKGNFGPQPWTYKGIAGGYHSTWSGWDIITAYRQQWLRLSKPLQTRRDWLQFSKLLSADAPLQKLVRDFYEALYWDSLHLDLVANQSIAEMMADHGVNAGVGRVGWMAQWVLRVSFGLHVDLDGQIGTQTLKAINNVNPATFHARFADLRRDFYRYRCGEYKPEPRHLALHAFFRTKLNLKTSVSQKIYLNTWLRRVQDMSFREA